jgi:hypothetical protein
MNPPTPIYDECSAWLQQLVGSPLYRFDDLPGFRYSLKRDAVGAYAIWFRSEKWKNWLCLKVGKAQRKAKSLSSRLYDHWHSRELPNPNMLVAHLMADSELALLSREDLSVQGARRRILERWCRFQAVEVREGITPRDLAILECRLAAELEPRYIERCSGYPTLREPGSESVQPTGKDVRRKKEG